MPQDRPHSRPDPPQSPGRSPSPPPDSAHHSHKLLNGAIGGLIAILFVIIPGSPLIGGFVAGLLEGGSKQHGVRAGVSAGCWTFVIVSMATVPLIIGIIGSNSILVLLSAVALFVYTVVLAGVGGQYGAYVRLEKL